MATSHPPCIHGHACCALAASDHGHAHPTDQCRQCHLARERQAATASDVRDRAELLWWRSVFAPRFGRLGLPPVGMPLDGLRFVLFVDELGPGLRRWNTAVLYAPIPPEEPHAQARQAPDHAGRYHIS